jgi:hypothetical protein
MSHHKPEPLHHLMRVRIRRLIFLELQEIAREESIRMGTYISVSDIVRSALNTWIQTHKSTDRLRRIVDKRG